MCKLSPVSFHGDTIFCIDYHGEPYAPMKPIVENMGLAWQSQAAKLSTNKERWGITMIVIPSEGGEQEMLCMPVRKLPAYLASINPKKVREELRSKIELYQAESDDALWNYWMNGKAEQKAKTATKRLSRQRPNPETSAKKELPPAKPLSEAGLEAMQCLMKLRADVFCASVKVDVVLAGPFGNNPMTLNLPEEQRPFAKSMRAAIGHFFMAINSNLNAAEESFKACIEAERMLNR